jgi:hypothetical protein
MSDGYPHKTIILKIYLWLSNQLIQYHQEEKNHILGWNFGNIRIKGFAITINARNGFLANDLQPQIIHLLHKYPLNFSQIFL